MQHHRRTWTVQRYSPGGASVQPHQIHASLGPPESTTETASRSIQPFLHSSRQSVVGHAGHVFYVFSLKSWPWHGAIRIPIYVIPLAHPSPQPKRHLRLFSCFCKAHLAVSLYFTMGRSFPPSNCPFPLGSALNVIAHVFHD